MRKVIASVSLLMCLSSSATAMDFRQDPPYFFEAGWDQKSLEKQTQGSVYLRAQIKKLERENELLRNTLSQLRGNSHGENPLPYDPRIQALVEENNRLSSLLERDENKSNQSVDTRIQALVEENKRLSSLLVKKNDRVGMSADAYAQKLHSLQTENQRVQDALRKVVSQSELEFNKNIESYKQENAHLKALLVGKTAYQSDSQEKILLLEETINNLKKSNAQLEVSLAGKTAYQLDSQERILLLEETINNLKKSNAELLVSQEEVSPSSLIDKDALREKNTQIASLQNTIGELQGENRRLGQKLAESSAKVLSYSESAESAKGEMEEGLKSVNALKLKLTKIQEENKTLKSQLGNKKTVQPVSNKEELLSLRKQNQSLRDTIRAQNDVLVSADNASKTAERMLTENTMLQRKLEQSKKSNVENGKSAKELFAHNQILKNEIERRDVYIKKLQGLKDTVKQLRMENDKYALGSGGRQDIKAQLSIFHEKNRQLESDLQKERDNTIAYRTKIREYQEQLATIKHTRSEEMAEKISFYKEKVSLLEKSDKSKDKKLTSLQLDNQELKARIILLSTKPKPSFFRKESTTQKNSDDITPSEFDSTDLLEKDVTNTSVEYIRGEKKVIARANKKKNKNEEAVFVDTEYPPVDQVVPLLDKNGSRIPYDNGALTSEVQATEASEHKKTTDLNGDVQAEDILAEGLKPLANYK